MDTPSNCFPWPRSNRNGQWDVQFPFRDQGIEVLVVALVLLPSHLADQGGAVFKTFANGPP